MLHSSLIPEVLAYSYLVPWVLLTRVLPTSLTLKMDGAFTSYQSLRVNGSTIFFLAPFLPALRPYAARIEYLNTFYGLFSPF